MEPDPFLAYWSFPGDRLASMLGTRPEGLSTQEAQARLADYGKNEVIPRKSSRLLSRIWDHFSNPLLLILIFAAIISLVVRDWLDASIVLIIIVASAAISIQQEQRASDAVARLRRQITLRSTALRDGQQQTLPSDEIVPGDVVCLSAGNLVPADGIVLKEKDLFINQSVLSGETFPVEKQVGTVSEQAALNERRNCVFMGTSVSSGTARILIVRTGMNTEFGGIAKHLSRRDPETEFEKGLRQFGTLLMQIMVLIVLAVLAVNVILHRATIDTFLFAVALAVGLSPELLPAIFSVTLARGSQKMASKGVIVKRLNAIENLGGMNVLCTDKTGTLTQGVIKLDGAVDADGNPDAKVERWAYLNASMQTGLSNPLDQAIVAAVPESLRDANQYAKLDEIPYDFQRRRLSIVVKDGNGDAEPSMIMKGALQNVLDVCDRIRRGGTVGELDAAMSEKINERFTAWSNQGFRVLGLAQRPIELKSHYGSDDEHAMIFSGFLLFFDPPEANIVATLRQLQHLGVQLKIITGDNHAVACHVAQATGIKVSHMLTGAKMSSMSDEALWHRAGQCNLFAEVDPNQKERIVRALQKRGHIVGFLGDGINDAPALHAADVGISVDRAVDVAKEAADFVLLKHDLNLLIEGIQEGRRTFANTLKYVFITTSANFGNMISMAAAALFLPFLPLLAKQILLNNFLSDIPAMGLADDNVDREWSTTPHRWNIRMIRNFMISFGLISTCFDFLTFGMLRYLIDDSAILFRTGWFVESVLTELFILVVIRTYRPLHQSRPSSFLILAILCITGFTIALPYLPFAGIFEFAPLPPLVMACILLITLLYIFVSEVTKRHFYRRFGFGTHHEKEWMHRKR
ncbi:MAG: magnesium-translocating P-type ATPase [Burkholderiaceae bacterium]